MRRASGARAAQWSLLLVVAVGLGLTCAGCSRDGERPAGILLISADTLRADRLNCYGYARRTVSPQVDRLAREGIVFESHITPSPWTTPAHMSLFTGRYPTAHGITMPVTRLENALKLGKGYPQLAPEIPTLPELLQGAGWRTAAFTGGRTIDPRIGFGRGFELYDTSLVKLSPKKLEPVLTWLEGARSRSFFLFFHTFEIHAPYLRGQFVEEALGREGGEALRRGLTRLLRQPGWKSVHEGRAILERHAAFTQPVCDALYDGGVLAFDEHLGRLLEWLRARGLYDRMLIVLTSDHGEQLGERDGAFYDRHGDTVYDEIVRVPLIVKLPGQRHAGTRVTGVTRGIDLLPTVLELAGVQPVGEAQGIQGRSLRPFWRTPSAAPRLDAVSEAGIVHHENKALRTERQKLILTMSPEQVERLGRATVPETPSRRELYDLVADPREVHDLLGAGQAGESKPLEARLRQILSVRAARVGQTTLDAETVENLKALGYTEEGQGGHATPAPSPTATPRPRRTP